MKKFDKNPKDFKKEELSFEEHEEFASDLLKAQNILQPWVQRFYYAYSVNGKEVKQLINVLNLLSSKICCTQDDVWWTKQKKTYKDNKFCGKDSPYYGTGKIAW